MSIEDRLCSRCDSCVDVAESDSDDVVELEGHAVGGLLSRAIWGGA